MYLNTLPNCTSQLKMVSCMFADSCVCMRSQHFSLEIMYAVYAGFSFPNDVNAASFNFYLA